MQEHSRIVLIAGPGGVGKTESAKAIFARLDHAAVLDIDNLMTTEPWVYGDELFSLAILNATAVIANMLSAGFTQIVLSGGVHNQKLIDEFRSHLPDRVSVYFCWLDANPAELSRRRVQRNREPADVDLGLHEFFDSLAPHPGHINGVQYYELDTTELSRVEVTDRIAHHLRKHGFEFRDS